MSEEGVSVSLSEWETLSHSTCEGLVGRFLDRRPYIQKICETLNSSRMLRLTELRDGLEVASFSYVGRVQVGGVTITILPKLEAPTLLRLLRYAYGFRRLELVSESSHRVERCGFEDLLISQLNAEVQEIISRGLQRSYVRRNERLASPRGRINVDRLALDGRIATATLPCQYFPRLEDTFLNRVLLAGLRLASVVASSLEMRSESRRLASLMEEQVSRINLDASALEESERRITRLLTTYVPALSIIRLLVKSQSIVLEGKSFATTLPGFLFDMNLFFQALISRFLKENLVGCAVRDEHGLKGMMRYSSKYNPQRKPPPSPRPDYAIMRQGELVALLDAKYRDLWEKSLPRDMLYQLVVYAISQREQRQSGIIYPTTDPWAKEARIDVTDPVYGKHLGQVCLRPVNLTRIEELVSSNSADAKRERERTAERLTFGESL